MPVFTEVLPIDNATGASFQLPQTEDVKVMAVRVTIDNSGGSDTQPELALLAPTGAVIATERQSEAIPAGDSGMASWALRLAKKAGGAGGAGWQFDTDNEGGWGYVVANNVGPDLPEASVFGMVIGETTGQGTWVFSRSGIIGTGTVLYLQGGNNIGLAAEFALATPLLGGFGGDDSFPRVSVGVQANGQFQMLDHLGHEIMRVDTTTSPPTYHIKAGGVWVADL